MAGHNDVVGGVVLPTLCCCTVHAWGITCDAVGIHLLLLSQETFCCCCCCSSAKAETPEGSSVVVITTTGLLLAPTYTHPQCQSTCVHPRPSLQVSCRFCSSIRHCRCQSAVTLPHHTHTLPFFQSDICINPMKITADLGSRTQEGTSTTGARHTLTHSFTLC